MFVEDFKDVKVDGFNCKSPSIVVDENLTLLKGVGVILGPVVVGNSVSFFNFVGTSEGLTTTVDL